MAEEKTIVPEWTLQQVLLTESSNTTALGLGNVMFHLATTPTQIVGGLGVRKTGDVSDRLNLHILANKQKLVRWHDTEICDVKGWMCLELEPNLYLWIRYLARTGQPVHLVERHLERGALPKKVAVLRENMRQAACCAGHQWCHHCTQQPLVEK